MILCFYSFWCLVPSRNVPQGEGHGRKASISLYPNFPSFLVQFLSLNQQLFHACTYSPYPSILQLAFLLRPTVLFLHKLFTIVPQSIFFHPFHYTTLHSMCTRSHVTPFIHAFIALTLSSCHATCSSQITISTTHTLDCCALFHVRVSDSYVNVGRRILFRNPHSIPWIHSFLS